MKIYGLGRLVRDPEVRDVTGNNVTVFDIAVNYRNPDGSETPNYFRVSVWGKRGESCQKYLRKGDEVEVSGDFVQREYVKSDGSKGFVNQINNSDVQFTHGKANNGQTPVAQAATPPAPKAVTVASEDDLPF